MSSGLYSGVSGLALGTGLYKGVSGLWSGASGLVTGYGGGSPYGGASLYLDFLTMTAPTFDSRITFTRGSNATLTDSTGKVTYAPANLLTYSQDFSNAAWVNSNTPIKTGGQTDPNGGTTAMKLELDVNDGIYQFAGSRTGNFIFSVWVKGDAAGTIRLSDASSAAFDINVNVTTEWTRVSTGSRAISGFFSPYIYRATGNLATVYVAFAQLEPVTYQTTPGTYNATTSSAYYGPRFDYDPVTLALKGLLIEDQEVNLLLNSGDLTSYSILPATGLTSTANATTAPDGTATARRLTNTATTEQHRLYQGQTLTAATAYTYTVYLKNDTAGWAQISFFLGTATTAYANINLATGALGSTGGGTSYSATPAGNGWYRLRVTATTEATGCNIQLYVLEANEGLANPTTTGTVKSIYVWGAQLEVSAYASSYIPTVASTVSRGADSVYITGTNFSSWYNQSEGTLVTSSIALSTASGRVASVNSGSFANSVIIGNGTGQIYSGGVSQGYIGATQSAGVIAKQALVYATNDMAYVQNGGVVSTDTTITLPVGINQLSIGNSGGGAAIFGGHIRELAYFNSRQANATLQTLTAPSTVPSLTLDFTSGSYSVGY